MSEQNTPTTADPKCEVCGHERYLHTRLGDCSLCFCHGYRPPASPEQAESEGKWKPTDEIIARGEAFRGECFAVDYGNAIDYDEAFAEKMREREKWYNAGWQGRKRYEAEKGRER